jgi:hypothetical protein
VQVTFSEAAKVLGFKSRSTLYRLKDSELARYVRPPAHRGGAQMLELAPEGLPTLREWLDAILQQQAKTAAPLPADLPALAFGAPSPAPSPVEVDPAAVAAGLAQLVAGMPEDAIPNLATSRERRAHYQAELARLEALEKRGDLLPKVEIMSAAFSVARTTRDMFLAMPSRLAPQLVGVADTQVAFALLDKEIRHALSYLSDATEHLGQ